MDNLDRGTGDCGTIVAMRWSELFDDLEAQLAAAEAAELRGEVAEHTRASLGRVSLHERLVADLGRGLRVRVRGGAVLEGALSEVGRDWLVLADHPSGRAREMLVGADNIVLVQGLSGRSDPGVEHQVQRALGLRQVLRAVSRDRSPVRVHLVEGEVITGTIDRVGADHLDVGTHPADLPRRSREVHSVLTVPYVALAALTRQTD